VSKKSATAVGCGTKAKPFRSSEKVAASDRPSRIVIDRTSFAPMLRRRMLPGPNVSFTGFAPVSTA